MIEGAALLKQMGKKKFTEFVTHSQKGETGAQRQRRRRFGRGRTYIAYCKHGKKVIYDFEPTNACKACIGETGHTKSKDFQPYFNIGLGCFVESRSEEKRVARQKGLVEAG